MAKKTILLTGVFGPFGVDDDFGRRQNVMELFHNQVTKAQGLASLRFHHRSFGLYFLAENISAPVTVLDFPSRAQFIRELKRQRYDAVGISFIVSNFSKAREMARLVRLHQPHAEIILGGHGAAIEGIEKLIDCDHVVRGEGIGWLRRYVGDNPNAPIHHPALVSAEHKRIFGVPTPGVAGLLVPGVGCVNGCRFCATSHFFGRRYTPFFSTGQQLFDLACRLGDELGTDEFFVMDENFLKDRPRALQLLRCMEQHDRPFKFAIFSSAEAIESFGIENMVRLGVFFVWIGAESKREVYEKNQGRDLRQLVRSLRDNGISVLVSGMLFLEHHTPESIRQDIDYLVQLEGDFTQFMMFTPLPGTQLYEQYKRQQRLDFDLPYEEWHGQHSLNFHHPHFTRDRAREILNAAFQTEFDRLSSSVLRMTDTALRGYVTLRDTRDRWLALRRDQALARAQELRLLLPTILRFAHNDLEYARALDLQRRFDTAVGRPSLQARATSLAVRAIAELHALRTGGQGMQHQPSFQLSRYRWQLAPVSNPLPQHRTATLAPAGT